MMKLAAFAVGILAFVVTGVAAQSFINLGFEQADLPDPSQGSLLTWGQGAPGWSHAASAEGDFLGYEGLNLGYSVSYALYPLAECCGSFGTGSYALAMRSGTFFEQEPRGAFVQASVWQTGVLQPGVTTVTLLASDAAFSLTLNGTLINMRPIRLNPSSPSYEHDLPLYSGEWSGDVSAFAGQLVELRVSEIPRVQHSLVIDDIRFLPVPEPSTAALLGMGLLIVPLAGRWFKRTGRAERALRHRPRPAPL